MEQAGWIAAVRRCSENNRPARCYRLTAAGRKQLASEEQNSHKLTEAVYCALNFSAANA